MIPKGDPTQYIGMMPPNSRAPSTAMQSPDKPQIAQVQPDSLMAPAVHEEPRAANLLKMNRPDMACTMPSAINAPDPALNNEKRTMLPAPTESNVCRGKAASQGTVRARGLEPPWLAPHGPKPCACTNSATPAGQKEIYPRKMLPVSSLDVAPTIHDALAAGGPVVALESAVITHGLPKAAAMEAVARQWDACAKQGATPAVVAGFGGRLRGRPSLGGGAPPAGRPHPPKASPREPRGSLTPPGFCGDPGAGT